MLARCPPNDLSAILEPVGSPAFVVGFPAHESRTAHSGMVGSAAVLAANGRFLAVLDGLSPLEPAGWLEREFERCRSGGATVELDHKIALPRRVERWHLVLAPVLDDGVVVRIVVTVAAREPL